MNDFAKVGLVPDGAGPGRFKCFTSEKSRNAARRCQNDCKSSGCLTTLGGLGPSGNMLAVGEGGTQEAECTSPRGRGPGPGLSRRLVLASRDKESLLEEIIDLKRALLDGQHQLKLHKTHAAAVDLENRCAFDGALLYCNVYSYT